MTKAASITDFLQERIDAGDFPSAVYLVAETGDIVLHDALGYAVVDPERIEATLDTIYDLASLTKPLITGLLSTMLIEANEINIDEQADISDFLSDVDHDDLRAPTIRELLTHTSGLPAWKPFYLLVTEKKEILSKILRTELKIKPRQVIYSDLNFILLGIVLERFFAEPLSRVAENSIFGTLNLKSTLFNPPNELQQQIAASESGNEFERQMCIDQGYAEFRTPLPAFRTETIWGEVHDGNAYFMGGVAGHAGLFSTAEEVFKIAQQFLPNSTTLLKPDTCELFRINFTRRFLRRMNEDRSFAFQLASTKDSTAGTRMSPQSFGHTGFTGTSLWIDPVKERIFILLTNRTHNRDLPFANINPVRRRFHDLAVEQLERDS